MRPIRHIYTDPLDLIWTHTLAALGITLQRSTEVYASWDGDHILTLATPDQFDPDDCLAQLVFHEICHGVVEGDAGRRQIDWGLDNTNDRHLAHEHACLRLQAAWAAQHGLRAFLAATTEHRAYYDALPDDPIFADPHINDPATDLVATTLARTAWQRLQEDPWYTATHRALSATAEVVQATAPFSDRHSLYAQHCARHT